MIVPGMAHSEGSRLALTYANARLDPVGFALRNGCLRVRTEDTESTEELLLCAPMANRCMTWRG
jgi:hypothetical protein